MKMINRFFLSLLLLSVLMMFACAPKLQQKQKALLKAQTEQQLMNKLGEQATQALAPLIQKSNSIQIQGRGLSTAEMSFVDKVSDLAERLELWKKTKVVLPTSAEEMRISPKELLAKQEKRKTIIKAIQKEMDELVMNDEL